MHVFGLQSCHPESLATVFTALQSFCKEASLLGAIHSFYRYGHTTHHEVSFTRSECRLAASRSTCDTSRGPGQAGAPASEPPAVLSTGAGATPPRAQSIAHLFSGVWPAPLSPSGRSPSHCGRPTQDRRSVGPAPRAPARPDRRRLRRPNTTPADRRLETCAAAGPRARAASADRDGLPGLGHRGRRVGVGAGDGWGGMCVWRGGFLGMRRVGAGCAVDLALSLCMVIGLAFKLNIFIVEGLCIFARIENENHMICGLTYSLIVTYSKSLYYRSDP